MDVVGGGGTRRSRHPTTTTVRIHTHGGGDSSLSRSGSESGGDSSHTRWETPRARRLEGSVAGMPRRGSSSGGSSSDDADDQHRKAAQRQQRRGRIGIGGARPPRVRRGLSASAVVAASRGQMLAPVGRPSAATAEHLFAVTSAVAEAAAATGRRKRRRRLTKIQNGGTLVTVPEGALAEMSSGSEGPADRHGGINAALQMQGFDVSEATPSRRPVGKMQRLVDKRVKQMQESGWTLEVTRWRTRKGPESEFSSSDGMTVPPNQFRSSKLPIMPHDGAGIFPWTSESAPSASEASSDGRRRRSSNSSSNSRRQRPASSVTVSTSGTVGNVPSPAAAPTTTTTIPEVGTTTEAGGGGASSSDESDGSDPAPRPREEG